MQLAHPLLKAAGGSSIVMISSVAGGPTAMRSGTVYAMTKGVIVLHMALLRCSHLILSHGRVLACAPGAFTWASHTANSGKCVNYVRGSSS